MYIYQHMLAYQTTHSRTSRQATRPHICTTPHIRQLGHTSAHARTPAHSPNTLARQPVYTHEHFCPAPHMSAHVCPPVQTPAPARPQEHPTLHTRSPAHTHLPTPAAHASTDMSAHPSTRWPLIPANMPSLASRPHSCTRIPARIHERLPTHISTWLLPYFCPYLASIALFLPYCYHLLSSTLLRRDTCPCQACFSKLWILNLHKWSKNPYSLLSDSAPSFSFMHSRVWKPL
jgi:hypothetical protein